ncbi:ATP-binding protein [Geodermatophilus sp. SYSU D00697]
MSAQWEQLPPPDVSPGPMWSRAPRAAAELTAMRGQLHTALRAGPLAIAADADAVETVLLIFEELVSNGLRHGRPPVHVTVAAAGTGWLLEVSDAAGDRPPIPAVGRDPAHGGLGLHLVARLSRPRLDRPRRPQARLGPRDARRPGRQRRRMTRPLCLWPDPATHRVQWIRTKEPRPDCGSFSTVRLSRGRASCA